ncbi:MAG: serine protease, partial [Bacteroidales bacterium]|nr:serine protease [Bacteroidales bacterium]
MNKLSAFLSILAFLITTSVFSQIITPNPTVDKDCSDDTSILPITSVATGLGDDKITVITFQYATTLFKPWILFDSKTFLTTDKSNAKLQILDWGIITDDEDEPFVSLDFDEQYFVKSRTLYDLYMVFPEVSETVKILNIQEPGKDGFYWMGIHINTKNTEDLSKASPGYPQNDGFNPTGAGTGFAISTDGYIATCHHVIANANVIKVRGINGDFEKTHDAKIVSIDEKNDL